MNTHEFVNMIKEAEVIPFRAAPYYCEESGSIILYLRDVLSYSERLSDDVDVMLSMEDNSVVGVQIHGIKALVEGKS